MKFSFLEDFLRQVKNTKHHRRTIATVGLTLAVVVFISSYLVLSQTAITMVTDQLGLTKPYDFANNITEVTVTKQDGNTFVDLIDNQVQDGDTIQVDVAYLMNKKDLAPGQNTMTYQLPAGLAFQKKVKEDLVVGRKTVGTYTINKKGLLTLCFDDSFKYTKGFDGELSFLSEIDSSVLTSAGNIQLSLDCTLRIASEPEPPVLEEPTPEVEDTTSTEVPAPEEGTLTVPETPVPEAETPIVPETPAPEVEAPTAPEPPLLDNSFAMTPSFAPALVPPLTSMAPSTAYDFEDDITNVVIKRIVNNAYVDLVDGKVYDGDQIHVKIAYTVPEGQMLEGQNKIYYQLPEGIVPNDNLSGNVKINGINHGGTYVIDKSGLITITLNEEKIDCTKEFHGTISFEGMIAGDASESQDDIVFTDDYTIHVDKKIETPTGYDLSGTKTAVKQADGSIQYTVNVSSNHGTSDVVYISDILEGGPGMENGEYYDFVVTTKNGDSVDVQPNVTNSAPAHFDMTLPQLGKNEGYTITYRVKPTGADTPLEDGSSSMTNTILGYSGDNHFESSVTTDVRGRKVSKAGKYDPETGKITWTVTLKPGPDGLAGYTFKDVMTIAGVESTDFEDVVLKDGNTKIPIKLPFTFDDTYNKDKTYTITYTTDVSDLPANQSNSVTNRAVLYDKDESYDDSKSITGIVRTTYDLTKRSTGVDEDTNTYHWKSTIDIPNEEMPFATDLVYIDELGDLQSSVHYTNAWEHYTTVDELSNMVVTIDGEPVTYDIWCKCTAPTYAEYNTLPADSSLRFNTFQLTFAKALLEENKGKTITIAYDSCVDPSTTMDGVDYTVPNTARVGTKSARAEADFSKGSGFSKLVSTNNSQFFEKYSGDISYKAILNEKGQAILSYRISIQTPKYTTLPSELVDLLPEGATLVEGSFVPKFVVKQPSGQYIADSVWIYNDKSNPDLGSTEMVAKKYVTCTPGTDGTIHFTIADNFKENASRVQNGDYMDLEINYQIALPDPDDWDNSAKQDFTNSLTYGGSTVENKVIVKNEDGYLTKTGSADSDTNSANYTLVINKSESDISVGNTIQLKDVLRLQFAYGDETATASLHRDSIKLYYYDANAEGNRGELVSLYDYTCSTSTKTEGGAFTSTIEMTVPDETAFVLDYSYTIYNNSPNDLTIRNTATLVGKGATTANEDLVLEKLDSESTVHQDIATVYKHEEGKENKLLPGATFTVESYDGTAKTWTLKETLVTNELGELTLLFTDDLLPNTLYRMQETVAPSGYVLDSNYRYFMWSNTTLDQNSIKAALGYQELPVQWNSITVFSPGRTTLLVPNTLKTSIEVQKQWLDTLGNPLNTPPDKDLPCELFQFVNGEPTEFKKSFTLSHTDNWTKEFDLVPYREDGQYGENELPKTDAEGNLYFYSVSETKVPDGYQVHYLTNIDKGIPQGALIIQNSQVGYTLPETGGPGIFYPLALGLLSITLVLGIALHRKKRT